MWLKCWNNILESPVQFIPNQLSMDCAGRNYLTVGWTPDQLGAYLLHSAAECCGSCFGSGCLWLCTSHSQPQTIQLMSHTEDPSFRIFDSIEKFCVVKRRFQITIHHSLIPFSILLWSIGVGPGMPFFSFLLLVIHHLALYHFKLFIGL